MEFYAHSTSDPNKTNWQPLIDHLTVVGKIAEQSAQSIGWAQLAKAIGLLHDLGKYCQEFQERLQGDPKSVDHATWGAITAFKKYGNLGQLMAYVIAGHHAGLANGIHEDTARLTELERRLNKEKEGSLPVLAEQWKSEIEHLLPVKIEMNPFFKVKNDAINFQLMLLARILLSSLVDADRLDTEAFALQAEGKQPAPRGNYPTLISIKKKFDQFLSGLPNRTDIQQKRNVILKTVRENAAFEPGLFSLTVPTGGGKTFTSMAFALDHAALKNKRRIIFVIPFTSIIEQTASVFRRALDEEFAEAIIEHHSAFNEAKISQKTAHIDSLTKLKLAQDNWDAPIIITTVVQFLESLFSSKTSPCRKLHNIANSVIVMDEAQTLPLHLLRPSLVAIDELNQNYGCSIVLCTATQPAIRKVDGFLDGLENVRELAQSADIQPQALYEQFRRVTIKHIGAQNDEKLIERISQHEQILCIVNNRKQARELYRGIAALEGSFHLSTFMCSVHRSQVLQEIREYLEKGQPCRVISTSLIEAGVDVSFPHVLRADAGLDSIAQAAGRCNREGKWEIACSLVEVFTPQDHSMPTELQAFASTMQEILRLPDYAIDPLGIKSIRKYFELLYWQKESGTNSLLDREQILTKVKNSKINSLPFDWVDQKFKLIESTMCTVIVPFDAKAEELIEKLKALPTFLSVGKIARQLQVYTVSVPERVAADLVKVGALQYIQPERFGQQFLVLDTRSMYTTDVGFDPDREPLLLSGMECNW
ncbi:CRISPR-associated helicase Cas3' [Alkanindiges illinoisensis]|uniref:CRISPR-associated helicase Cas3 n=1 Tax=Alkanindiges illinoisensis TaxID=197183 RepID=A0A4Y7XG05_9GAMM|nr:CRISPR-associated helicase Cas3' [Alkanindiges illinoisensis]TEU30169.1 CRISPR-associated helicase Cas3' [Alkanindiges illinoisensis]